ncbi:AAA family ATPase [Deinococcus sp. KNUC1210]|uniref:AAA family ATPase n=1 Tax=Deinococcus sp. KNUC1210 TaxID=2917691 RepID=UPI00351D769E
MITSLSLQGFKSFAALTRLEFGPGVSAVIGPNGSGKSNVVEAIRWVTHNARARELRAARASDLIFHGSGSAGSGRAPLGLAEVQLELRTPAGERVHLARRLYQDGSSEQDIAGRPSRVRDVQAALRGTGLGNGGLAVIGQGEVSGVVQAAGSVLLAHLQEAAGLSRSVAARQDTAARLTEAATHLAQVRLLEAELEQRRARLETAAHSAARHHVLTLDVLAWQDALARARALNAQTELEALRRRVETLGAESAALAQAIQDAAAALDRAREAARIAREEARQHQQALELHQAAVRAAEQSARYLEHLEGERIALEREATALPLIPPPRPRRIWRSFRRRPTPVPVWCSSSPVRPETPNASSTRPAGRTGSRHSRRRRSRPSAARWRARLPAWRPSVRPPRLRWSWPGSSRPSSRRCFSRLKPASRPSVGSAAKRRPERRNWHRCCGPRRRHSQGFGASANVWKAL